MDVIIFYCYSPLYCGEIDLYLLFHFEKLPAPKLLSSHFLNTLRQIQEQHYQRCPFNYSSHKTYLLISITSYKN